VYNHYNIYNIPIYFYNIYLKHFQHTSYVYNMRFQQNMTATQAEHSTAGSGRAVAVEEDGSGRVAMWL
jgi:hypothetical protein